MGITTSVEMATPVVNRRGRRVRPRFSLPQRPRFTHELVVVQLQDKMLVDGTDRLHVFEGKAAQGLLSALIPLMDGTRTMEQIESVLPEVPPAEIAEAIFSLCELRLVEDEAVFRTPPGPSHPEALAFFRRHAGATGVNRNGVEALEKLQNSKVLIFASNGAGEHVEALKFVLLMTGIAEVSVLNRELLDLWRPSLDRQSLIVSMSLGSQDFDWHARLDDWCSQHQALWLRAVIDENSGCAELGPVFRGGDSGCYHCFCRMHLQPRATSFNRTITAEQLRFFTSLVAIEVTYQLNQIGLPLKGRDFQRYALPEWQAQDLCWPRIPGCARCLPITNLISSPGINLRDRSVMNTAYVFESYVGHESSPVSSTRAHLEASAAGRQIALQCPRFLNCPQYNLNSAIPEMDWDALEVLRGDSPVSEKPITTDELAAILLMTAGLRSLESKEQKIRRWAPTGGNLGSVQLFVAVRYVEGLSPGLYLYQPAEHSLARFQRRSGVLEIENFMQRVAAGNTGELPEAMVLFVGAFGRISRKYGFFGYRLVNLDAGAALSQLHLVAGSLGRCSQTANRWADDLIADQLNLDPIKEQVTAVVSLSRKRVPASSFPGPVMAGMPPSAKPPQYFSESSLSTIFEMVFRESRVQEQEIGWGAFAVPPELLEISWSNDTSLPLPPPAHAGRAVGPILTSRASVRHYTPEPVGEDQLSTMLHLAIQGDRNDWPQEYRAGRSLRLLALAWNVKGLAPGVYEYIDEDHALAPLACSLAMNNAIQLFVQSEFAAAPLIVWISGNLAAACAAYAAFGHRQLLLRAGAAAHRLWMAALAGGLGGTIVAGVVPGAARRLLDLDGYQKASLVAFAAGYPFKPFGLRVSPDSVSTDSLIAP
jgi:SagB-type dehydrogenase family enzyme